MPAILLSLLLNRYTIGAIVAVGLILGAYWKGYSSAASRCHDAELRNEIASLQRDVDAAKAADTLQAQLKADLEAQNAELQQKVTDYVADTALRPDNRCALTPDDVRALDGLRVDGGR